MIVVITVMPYLDRKHVVFMLLHTAQMLAFRFFPTSVTIDTLYVAQVAQKGGPDMSAVFLFLNGNC